MKYRPLANTGGAYYSLLCDSVFHNNVALPPPLLLRNGLFGQHIRAPINFPSPWCFSLKWHFIEAQIIRNT